MTSLNQGVGEGSTYVVKSCEANKLTHPYPTYHKYIKWHFLQDGVCCAEDIETAVTEGLGLRYSLLGPFETMQLNANGMVTV